MPNKLPAAHCVICDKPLVVTGGKRVYWSSINRVMVNNQPEPLLSGWRAVQLSGKYLTYYGPIWNELTINRAIDIVQQGYLPWFCQRCGKVGLCMHCGHPLTSPPGAEIINDDGTTSHVPVFAGLLPCPACDRHNERFS